MFITVKVDKIKIYLFMIIIAIIIIVGGFGYRLLKDFNLQNTNGNIDAKLNRNIVSFIEGYG